LRHVSKALRLETVITVRWSKRTLISFTPGFIGRSKMGARFFLGMGAINL